MYPMKKVMKSQLIQIMYKYLITILNSCGAQTAPSV